LVIETCLVLASAANRLPVRCLIQDPNSWKSLDPVAPTGILNGYSTTAGRLCIILPRVLISRHRGHSVWDSNQTFPRYRLEALLFQPICWICAVI